MSNSHLLNQVILTFIDNFKEHREDLSALLLTHQKYLWLGSDETSTIERLSLVDTDKFTDHQQFRVAEFINLPAPENEEIDIEDLLTLMIIYGLLVLIATNVKSLNLIRLMHKT